MRKFTQSTDSNSSFEGQKPSENWLPELQVQTVAVDPLRWSQAARHAGLQQVTRSWMPPARLH
jgi:hypothetical protein